MTEFCTETTLQRHIHCQNILQCLPAFPASLTVGAGGGGHSGHQWWNGRECALPPPCPSSPLAATMEVTCRSDSAQDGSVTKPNLDPLAQRTAKRIYWHGVWWREVQSLSEAPSKEYRWLMLRRPFQGRVFKGKTRGEGCRMRDQLWTFFWLVGGEVTGWCFGNLNHQPSDSNCSGVYVLVVSMQLTSSTRQGFWNLQNNSGICLRILSMALEKELKVLDFVLWLNYYYFVLLDCFLLFLYFFFTSLIKFFFLELREGLGG